MYLQFRILRKDNQQPIQGAKVVLEHGDRDGYTDATGRTQISTSWVGNLMYSVEAPLYSKVSGTVDTRDLGGAVFQVSLGALVPPAPPPPVPSGDEFYQQAGLSCKIYKNDSGIKRLYVLVDEKTGKRSPYVEIEGSLYEKYTTPFKCGDPMPSSLPEWQKGIADSLSKFYGETRSALDGLSSGIARIGKDLLDVEARIRAWVEEQILDILWQALIRERKEG